MSTKHDVRRMAEEIVAREGAFVNDPDDPGGATKYGVTIHTTSPGATWTVTATSM